MKGNTKLLTNFKWILKMLIPIVEVVQKKFKVYAISFSLKIVKIDPANKVQGFFSQNEMPSMPEKHQFPFLSLHCIYGPI
jgi:hypothetical protein